jgi:hypothetical protein
VVPAAVLCRHEAGKRPKLVLQAPPQHGKSRMVTDFISWAAGKNPDLSTIFASYSDELGTTANLRFQRILELPIYRKVWGNTRLASGEVEGHWQRNMSVCEFVEPLPLGAPVVITHLIPP